MVVYSGRLSNQLVFVPLWLCCESSCSLRCTSRSRWPAWSLATPRRMQRPRWRAKGRSGSSAAWAAWVALAPGALGSGVPGEEEEEGEVVVAPLGEGQEWAPPCLCRGTFCSYPASCHGSFRRTPHSSWSRQLRWPLLLPLHPHPAVESLHPQWYLQHSHSPSYLFLLCCSFSSCSLRCSLLHLHPSLLWWQVRRSPGR